MRPQLQPPAHRMPARAAVACGLTAALVGGGLIAATPAFAATTIMSKSGLSTAMSNAPVNPSATLELTVGTTLTTADATHDRITTPDHSDITLVLAGHAVALQQLTLGADARLTVVDSGDAYGSVSYSGLTAARTDPSSTTPGGILVGAGATLQVDGAHVSGTGTDGLAGIGSPTGVTGGAGRLVESDSAQVVGRGGDGGAGIGGAEGAAAISIRVVDSFVDGHGGAGGAGLGSGRDGVSAGSIASITSASSPFDTYLVAHADGYGGAGAAGIGGGLHGAGTDVTADGSNAQLAGYPGTADPAYPGSPSAVGFGQDTAGTAAQWGSISVSQGASLYVPGGADLTVPAGATLHNHGGLGVRGTISGAGTVENVGEIGLDAGYLDPAVDPAARISVAHVTGNNFLTHLDAGGATMTGRTTVHTFGRYLDYMEGFPSPDDQADGSAFVGWNAHQDGSGAFIGDATMSDITGRTSTDGDPIESTVYAQYGRVAAFTADAMPSAGLDRSYDQGVPVTGDRSTRFTIEEYDQNGDPLPGLPAGLTFDGATGRVSGTPTQAGTFTFTVSAGFSGHWTTRALTIRIQGAPVIATSSLPNGRAGDAYSTRLVATGEGDPRFDAPQGLPSGLALTADGVLSGTPTGAVTVPVTVRATSEFGPTTRILTLEVAPAAVATQPIAAPTATPEPVQISAPIASTPTTVQAAPTATPTEPPAAVMTVTPSAPVTTAPPAPPKLAAVPRTTVRFGHRLDLAVAADSASPVTYSASGALPKGIVLNRTNGLLSGVAAEVGVFEVAVTATSIAGRASTPVVIVVPPIEELIDAKAVPATKVGAGDVPVQVVGLKKGERWRIVLDGRPVQRGTMQRAGALTAKVEIGKAKRDTVHTVVVSTSRAVDDPSQRASTTFTVTSLAEVKRLDATRTIDGKGRVAVNVDRLAAHERVVVTEKGRVVARGTATEDGEFDFTSSKLAKGTHHLVVRGATAGRKDTLTVSPKHR